MWTSFVGQFDYPVRKDGYGINTMDGDIVILASCGYHFIRVNENLVQHPSYDKLGIYREDYFLSRVSFKHNLFLHLNNY